ncbi:uncharacterized protein LOC143362450 isoform X2 [Halictus rubicundus]|uniref:uncharacterized protein LOC143362450 isoform X2 n=1 Tax=Halictus rubicundus TaxID=77578 RepID=UPI00403717A9
MVIRGIVILSLLITQALCAPTGCIESCSSYTNQIHSQLSGIPNHGDITQGVAQLQGLDYSRPGTWTEHNDYNINNGKVHEEKGQIVDGHKTVRYFKKNYSSSFGTRYPSGSGISEVEQLSNNYRQGVYLPSSEDVFNSQNQRTYNQVGSLESIGQQHNYNKIQSQQHTQSSIRRTNTQSERLEDFGEHSGNSEVIQQGASGLNTQVSQQPFYTNTRPGNWSTVDSYKTDGGHGRVFEEEGQYTTGPKNVRYYKRNYTSSYSSSNGHPVPDIANIRVDDIHRDLENIHREIGLDHIHTNTENIHGEIGNSYNQVSSVQGGVTSSNTAKTNINSYADLNSGSLHSTNSDVYRRRPDYRNNLSSVHRNEQQHHTSIASEYVPQENPSRSTHGASSHRTYSRREGYVNTLPTSQYINPTSGYTNVLSTGNNGYNRNMYNEETLQQQTGSSHQVEHLDEHQSTVTQNHMDIDNLRQNTYNQHNVVKPVAHGRVSHYKEQWSSSQRQEASLPVYTSDISQISGQNAQYNSHYRQNSFNSAHQSKLGQLMAGAVDLSPVGHSDDCTQGTVEHSHVQSQYRRIYKRSTTDDKLSDEQQQTEQSDDPTQQTEDLTQQTGDFDDLTQQASGYFQFVPQFQAWGSTIGSQQSDDLTQQTGDFDDLTQQASGYSQFVPQFQAWGPTSGSQHSEDFTQQTGDFGDLTQQTSGKLQLGQQSHQPSGPTSGGQHSDDFTQQTGDFDDLTQQTSGKLQFGQQSHQPWGPTSDSKHSDDLTQQTGDFDDLTQQTSGKLQFGQQSHQPSGPTSGSQHSDDFTQQTGYFDDLTQQTSGKLQFGQQSHQPWGPTSDSKHSDDLTQQTGDFDDLTQQTSGKLQFGQQSHKPSGPTSGSQHSEDFTQQTGDFDDLTQQTSGKLQFGQQSHQPWGPTSDSKHSDDLTQQTGDFDDLTQQTSGKLQFGQQSHQPSGPTSGSQHSDDFTQQTGDFDDLTQQTSGKLQFGQQSHQPWGPTSDSKHSDDLTQQTGDFDDLTQQTSGKLQFGQQSHQPSGPTSGSQHSDDFTQQTGDFDDLTQQTSGKLQFGQQSHKPLGPTSGSQHSEDFTQQTGDFDDLTQQTSGKLQFGQQSHQPSGPTSGSQHSDDFTQQTGDFDDLTQQTSGKLQFGQQSHQSSRPTSGSQHSEDFTQQTGDFDDLTQQTSGKLQLGQQSYEPWGPTSGSQRSEDFTQQTGDFDDLTQQTSGKLQLGQQSYEPWGPTSGSQHSEDFTQQTGDFDDLTQQTSGKLQLGQQSYEPWGPTSGSQHSEDLTQQTGDSSQQSSGRIEFGQQSQHSQQPWTPGNTNQHSQDVTQQNEHVLQVSGINDNIPVDQSSHGSVAKPAGKPKPRSRYSRVGSVVGLPSGSHGVQDSNNVQPSHPANEGKHLIEFLNHSSDKSTDRVSELPPIVVPGAEADATRSQDIRGDQGVGSSTNNDKPLIKKTEGLQWHYTYHPSDQRPLVQQADKKDKGGMQQQSTIPDFSDFQGNLNQQQEQNKYILDSYQQSSSPGKEESGLYQQSQHGQEKDQLELGQQTLSETEDNTPHHLEPRILEAYGGGPYDELHNEDIYAGVTVNPSATLAPIIPSDSWYIQEKPAETNSPVYETTLPPLPVEPLSPNINEPTPPPSSFWSRLGNKFTNTFDKAKEKARNIFG